MDKRKILSSAELAPKVVKLKIQHYCNHVITSNKVCSLFFKLLSSSVVSLSSSPND